MTYKTFEDLEVWQNARILCKDIYVVTREDKFQKIIGLYLKSQLLLDL
jgi:hypothetical protein